MAANVNIKVRSDFDQASADLKRFGNVTEAERKKIEKFQASFKTEQIDKFIDRNRRAGAAVKATEGDYKSLEKQQKGLTREIQRLIRRGLDPQSDEVKKLRGEYDRLESEMSQVTNETKKGRKSLGLGTKAMGAMAVAAGVLGAARGVRNITEDLIEAGRNAEETENKFGVTFSSIRNEADLAAQNLQDNFGLSGTAAQQLLADTGDLLSGFGFTQSAALDLSTEMNELAVDLASFTNYSGGAAGASAKLAKAVLGEREGLKELGIAITEADIARLAEDKGITGELDRQAKAMLTLELATTQSKNAIGDYERSAGTLTQTQKEASAEFEDLAVNLGSKLQPAAIAVTEAFGNLAANINDALTAADRRSRQRIDEMNSSFEELIKTFDGSDESLAKIQERFPAVTRGIIDAATETGNYVDALNEVEKAQGKLQRIDYLEQFSSAENDVLAINRALDSLNLEMLDLSGVEGTGNWWEEDTRPAVERAQEAFDILNEQAARTKSTINLTSNDFEKLVGLIEQGDETGIENLLNSFVGANEAVEQLRDELSEIQTGSGIDELTAGVDEAAVSWRTYKDDALIALDRVFTSIDKRESIADALGEDFDVVEEKSEAIKKTIKDLLSIPADEIDEAFKISDNTIQELVRMLNSIDLSTEVWLPGEAEWDAATEYISDSVDNIQKDNEEAAEEFEITWVDAVQIAIDAFNDMGEGASDAMELAIDALLPVEKAFADTWKSLVEIAGTAGGPLGEAAADLMIGIMETALASEGFPQYVADLVAEVENEIAGIEFEQRKDMLDQLFDAELTQIDAIEEARLNAFLDTLSEKEIAALKSAGVIKETELERIERERQAAIDSGNMEKAEQLANEAEIEKIRAEAMKAREEAEKQYRNKVAQWEYEKAVFERELKISEAEGAKQTALADLPWWASKEKRGEVESIYDNLISTLSGVSIPSPPTFQTGGSFTVPENPQSTRGDSQLIRVNPGETADITPRGEGGGSMSIRVDLEGRTLIDFVNDKIESGEIVIRTDNIQGGVSV